jgi:hypothetical protein
MRSAVVCAFVCLAMSDPDEDTRLNEHWKATFPKIDTDNDNSLSLDEVTAYLQHGIVSAFVRVFCPKCLIIAMLCIYSIHMLCICYQVTML